jgi:hypothetical protein
VRLDALDVLMENGPYRQVTLEVLEGFLHRDELQVERPQLAQLRHCK